jgi:hypothetical protein
MTNEEDDPKKPPSVTDLLGDALERVAREWQPLLAVAVARLAGERYREWAATPEGGRYRSRLLACANRQDEIARAIEPLYADSEQIEQGILRQNSDLSEIDRAAFAGRALAEQFVIQARWARLNAAAWRSFAQHETDAARNRAFRACAELEELNALVLEVTISAPSS